MATHKATHFLATLPLMAAIFSAPAHAGEDNGLSDTQTSYTGAMMLEAGLEVSFDGAQAGSMGDLDNERYAFFSGNTLYAGVEDDDGNSVDMIAEFFWFESSIDRDSDFYVGVIKARTSPNPNAGWELEVADYPVLSLVAETDLSAGTGAFRWDWSIPFENYGMDSYGEVTMETSYGIDTTAEGSAMAATKIDEDGVEVSGTVQAKGYLNNSYKVQALYQVTLWRWEVDVHGTPGAMEWDMWLNNSDRADQNAYHEYFVVMQSEEGVPFDLDWLEVSGTVTDTWWFWEHSDLSVALTGLQLERPSVSNGDTGDDDDDDWWGDDDDTQGNAGDDDDEVDSDDDDDNDDDDGPRDYSSWDTPGCSTSGRGPVSVSGLLLTGLALGLALIRRRA